MTNREAHEEAAGMGLDDMFFRFNKIDPDAESSEKNLSAKTHLSDEDAALLEEFRNAVGLGEVTDSTARCPHCDTTYTYRDEKWYSPIRKQQHCGCPQNWTCTICSKLIQSPADFAEYEKNGAHVACAEKELTGIEHFPPQLTQAEKEELQTEERWGPPPEDDSYEPICEEWSHGWTNTETGVECARCGVRRGTCPECGHDEHGAVCPSPCLCMLQIKKIARAEYRKSTCENCGNVLTISDPNRFTDGEAILCGRCE